MAPLLSSSLEASGHHHSLFTHLLLGIGPARDLNDHVQHGLLLVRIERDVVEGRDGRVVTSNIDAVLEGVRRADLAGAVDARGLGLEAAAGGECLSHAVLLLVNDGGGKGSRDVLAELSSTTRGCLRRNFVGVGEASGAGARGR